MKILSLNEWASRYGILESKEPISAEEWTALTKDLESENLTKIRKATKKLGSILQDKSEDMEKFTTWFRKYTGVTKANPTIIDGELVINVDGNLSVQANGQDHLTEDGEYVFKFGTIKGDFKSPMAKLKSLEGCPEIVGGIFDVRDNLITSLADGPKEVGGDYWVGGNAITKLDGCPEVINGSFGCDGNKLTNLKGGPEKVKGNYSCSNNDLTSLSGIAKDVGREVDVSGNPGKFTTSNVQMYVKQYKSIRV